MIVILGATGKVGSKIAALLTKKSEPIRLISRSADRLRLMAGRNVTIFPGDANDTKFLIKAFTGADAVFTMIPPNPTVPEFLRYADAIGESIVRALKAASVKHVVNLSSVGAEVSSATGPINGLHNMEVRLNSIKGLNVMHIRAAYFMENLLMNVDLIRSKGITGSAVRGDLAIPMIASKDIATFAAEHLAKRDFTGTSVRYLLGQRDVTMNEASGIIGRKIAKPGLPYVAFSYEDAEKGMIAMGLSPDMSRNYVDMSRAFNEELIKAEMRTKENTTPTSIELFCDEVFVPAFAQKKAA